MLPRSQFCFAFLICVPNLTAVQILLQFKSYYSSNLTTVQILLQFKSYYPHPCICCWLAVCLFRVYPSPHSPRPLHPYPLGSDPLPPPPHPRRYRRQMGLTSRREIWTRGWSKGGGGGVGLVRQVGHTSWPYRWGEGGS